jgi:hypothetical protein
VEGEGGLSEGIRLLVLCQIIFYQPNCPADIAERRRILELSAQIGDICGNLSAVIVPLISQKNAKCFSYLRKSAISAGTGMRHFTLTYHKWQCDQIKIEIQIKKHGIYSGNCWKTERRKEHVL